MVLAGRADPGPGLTHPIPEAGLREVLSGWSGRGTLYAAIAAVEPDALDGEPNALADRRWSARDVEKRAHRILFEELLPDLASWPSQTSDWLDALPAQTHQRIELAQAPAHGTSWPRTRALGPWPPRSFVVRYRERTADQLLVTTLRWTLRRLLEVHGDAVSLAPALDEGVAPQFRVANWVIEEEPLLSAPHIPPQRGDLDAVRREGRPWTAVANVAAKLQHLEVEDLAELATRLVEPQERFRLFHLGVLGAVVSSLKRADCLVTWRTPLGAGSGRPAYEVHDALGRTWDLWFEAGGIWSQYGAPSPYRVCGAALGRTPSPLSPDLLLLRPGEAALALECKYGGADYVGRAGYLQAMAYGSELRGRLAERVHSVVVGPSGVVKVAAADDVVFGKVGFAAPEHLDRIVSDFVSS